MTLFTTYLQNVLGYTPIMAGFAFLPLSVCSMLASMKLVTLLLGKLGIRSTLVIGMTGVTVSMILLALGMSVDGSYWAVLPGVLVWGTSAGLAFPALFVSVSTGVPPQRQGVASALASTAQYLGSAVGLAALVAVANAGLGPDASADSIVDGLRLAGWIAAAVTLVGACLAAAVLRPQPAAAILEKQINTA
ncbi:MFS transporter [Rhodococcoides fascians]|uniref:MFS transporter n=1 Tax=Rhodococcoides fascians TaxID=1828 RepID=UPI00068A5775|nr:MFS transporter [Rhodococcus fascians]